MIGLLLYFKELIMKVLQINNIYKICDDDMVTLNALPVKTFRVGLADHGGFYLEQVSDFTLTETMFGSRVKNVPMVLDSYKAYADEFHRSLGVILSGHKGIGKSMFAKAVCVEAQRRGYPVVLVTKAYDGIAEFIGSIKQRVVVLFDEFDKIYGTAVAKEGKHQTELLTMFDGITDDTKLFVITCNNVNHISDYVVNRPGRFHYHFRFDGLSSDDIREYMEAKLASIYRNGDDTFNEAGKHAIDEVVRLGTRLSLNYDCMRSIVFELNRGICLKDFIDNLNILSTDYETYTVEATFDTGKILTANYETDDIYTPRRRPIRVYMCNDPGSRPLCVITFSSHDIIFNKDSMAVEPGNVEVVWMNNGGEDDIGADSKLTRLTIRRKPDDLYRYTV